MGRFNFILIAVLLLSFPLVYSQPSLHTLRGFVFKDGGTAANRFTPVLINLTTNNNTYRILTDGPIPPLFHRYLLDVTGDDGELTMVRAWNVTNYGESNGTLVASPSVTEINATLNLTRYPEANVSILNPSNSSTYNQTQVFNITANLTIVGANGNFCNATLSIANTSVIQLNGSETFVRELGNITRLDWRNTTWFLKALRQGSTNLTITSLCDNSTVNLDGQHIKTAFNITVNNTRPHIVFVSPTPPNNQELNVSYAYINVSVTDIDDTYAFIDWNYSLLLWLRMDHYSGSILYDNSSYQRNATVQADSVQIGGKFSYSFYFDGSDDYLNTTVNKPVNSTSFWYRNTTHNWTHVVNSSGTLYVNGQLATPDHYPLNVSGTVVQIGKTASGFFNGSLDEVLLFSRKLNLSEVLALYNSSAYHLENNFSGLTSSTFQYTAYAVDAPGDVNQTAQVAFLINLPPFINYNASVPSSPVEDQAVYIYANVTDDYNNLTWVNFTVTAPNGTIIINNQNGTREGDIWNSTSFNATLIGTWTWNITAFDGAYQSSTSGTFILGAWYIIFGNLTGQIVLSSSDNQTIVLWPVINKSGSHVYIADLENMISFTDLHALGRNLSNDSRFDDFHDADLKLRMENVTDSVNNTFTLGQSPLATENFSIFGVPVLHVPIVNSTNSSAFRTGICWDSDDDGTHQSANAEYDTIDGEDLVFITKVNPATQGKYGVYDFEIRIPAYLRFYNNTNGLAVSIYAEIQ